MYNLSTKDINFIRPFCYYLNTFLVTPWSSLFYSKIYAIVLLSLRVYLFVYVNISDNFWNTGTILLHSQEFLFEIININLFCLFLYTVIKNGFLLTGKWETFIQNFVKIDANLKNTKSKERQFLKNFYVGLVEIQLFFVAFCGYQFYFWTVVIPLPVTLTFFTTILDLYQEFLTAILIKTFLNCFKERYEDLNEQFEVVLNKQGSCQADDLLIFEQTFKILAKNVDHFNDIFGLQIILIITHCCLQMINCMNCFFLSLVKIGNVFRFVSDFGVLFFVFVSNY